MANYVVSWHIDIEDEPTPEAAARKAMRIMQDRRPENIAHVFHVTQRGRGQKTKVVDLDGIMEVEG